MEINAIDTDFFPLAEEAVDPKPWCQAVRDKISSQAYRYSSPKTSDETSDYRWDVECQIIDKTKKLSKKHPELFLQQILKKDALNMPGVAIVASYLRERKALDNLFVCKSLEAFQKKLEEVSLLEGNTRLALVLTDRPEVEKTNDKKDGEYGAVTIHKLAICIEKSGPQIKIAVLDPMADKEDVISPFQVHAATKDLKYIYLDGIGYPLWYLFHSSLDMTNTTIYYSMIKRQRTYIGCETFALNDGVAFLRDPHFFEKLQARKVVIKEGDAQLILHKIESLPPAFMTGTQSLKLLNKYFEKNLSSQDPKEMEKLKRKVEKHLVEVDGKLQNHYNDQKSIKYHLIAATSLEITPTMKLQQIIQETLLTTSRLPLVEGQPPKTLSDLHHYNPIVITEQD